MIIISRSPQAKVLVLIDSFGSIKAAELDWGNADHIRAVYPPFDYIIGTDVVSYNLVYVFVCIDATFSLLLLWKLSDPDYLGVRRASFRTSIADNTFIIWSYNHHHGTAHII